MLSVLVTKFVLLLLLQAFIQNLALFFNSFYKVNVFPHCMEEYYYKKFNHMYKKLMVTWALFWIVPWQFPCASVNYLQKNTGVHQFIGLNHCIILMTVLLKLSQFDWMEQIGMSHRMCLFSLPYVKFSYPPIMFGAFHNYLSYNPPFYVVSYPCAGNNSREYCYLANGS